MPARYRHNYEAFGRLVLRSEPMEREMRSRAERIKERFRETAPVGEPYEPDDHAGRYRDSAKVASGTTGGPENNRAYGRVTVDDPAAMSIEYGHHVERRDGGKFAPRGTGEPYPYIEGTHTLTQAMDAAGEG